MRGFSLVFCFFWILNTKIIIINYNIIHATYWKNNKEINEILKLVLSLRHISYNKFKIINFMEFIHIKGL